MTQAAFQAWLNLAGFLGIAILAVPTWSLNLRKKKLQRILEADDPAATDPRFRARVRAILKGKRERDVADWRRIDEWCLIAGYLLVLGAAALRVAEPALF
jgi:hypothetical protein